MYVRMYNESYKKLQMLKKEYWKFHKIYNRDDNKIINGITNSINNIGDKK